MRTIVIASRKGGSSKTTLAVHLSTLAEAEGGAVVIDADPQRSAGAWYELRSAERPFVIPGQTGQLREVRTIAQDEGFGFAIVDTAPHNEVGISEAMRLADLVVIPVRPSLFDLRAAEATVGMARSLNRPAVAVITGAPPRTLTGDASVVREARSYLAALPVEVCKATIGQRTAYSHALLSGSSAVEYEPTGKAARECQQLWAELKARLP